MGCNSSKSTDTTDGTAPADRDPAEHMDGDMTDNIEGGNENSDMSPQVSS